MLGYFGPTSCPLYMPCPLSGMLFHSCHLYQIHSLRPSSEIVPSRQPLMIHSTLPSLNAQPGKDYATGWP